MTTKEENASLMVHMARQTKIPPRSEGIVFVATDRKELVQTGPLLERDSIQEWTKSTGIIHAFLYRPFNVIVLNTTNDLLFFLKHLRIATELPPSSAIIRNK